MGDAKDDSLSNIAKLAIRAGWAGNDQPPEIDNQKVLYYSGSGTRGGFFLRTIRTLLSPETTIHRIINAAVNDLNIHCKAGDTIIIIGFSRGAAIARRFAAQLRTGAICTGCPVNTVQLLICFDTVAQIGKLDRSTCPDDSVVFEDNQVSPNVEKAYHLVSIDENRKTFPVTLMSHEDGARVKEIWFRGVHSDIGGGYPEHGLSDIPLAYAIDQLNDAGVVIRDPLEIATLPTGIEYTDIHALKNAFAPIHVHKVGNTSRSIHVIHKDKPNAAYQPIVHNTVREVMKRSNYLAARDTAHWVWE